MKSIQKSLQNVVDTLSNIPIDDATIEDVISSLRDITVTLRDKHRASERYLPNARAQEVMFAISMALSALKAGQRGSWHKGFREFNQGIAFGVLLGVEKHIVEIEGGSGG